jgi:large subunit ribosomal protein L17
MRHRKTGVKLNRTNSHKNAMFRNMVTSLFKYERIKTTDAKAKELRRWADKLITLAKRGDLHARRRALSIVREKNVVHKLFEEAPERFGSVSGGYTRIIKIGRRPGDAAPISLIELIEPESKTKKKKSTKKTKPAKTKKVEKKEVTTAEEAKAPVEPEATTEEAPEEKGGEGVAQETAPEENAETDSAEAEDDASDDSTEEPKAETEPDETKEEGGAEETGDEAEKKEEK